MELSRWPAAFRRYVELELASRIADRLSMGQGSAVDAKRDRARKNAKNRDAMNEAQPKFAPEGSWGRSRTGRISADDRGKRNTLIG